MHPSVSSLIRDVLVGEIQVQENKNGLGPRGNREGEGEGRLESIILGALCWVQADRHHGWGMRESYLLNYSVNQVCGILKEPFTFLIYTGEGIPSEADLLQSSQTRLCVDNHCETCLKQDTFKFHSSFLAAKLARADEQKQTPASLPLERATQFGE